ncbi:hypothetical protein COU61_02090 [Candidatus Pacearchaeota archaeon CG10_big_fil_rev_8_21_14_0_10_35_13]|nr:MAG: hypothetical protein COU61_02090 [Candidatus Pacearchaeota archaeon CG10_big_fil_rev_8_21_14_0_10_35_13]
MDKQKDNKLRAYCRKYGFVEGTEKIINLEGISETSEGEERVLIIDATDLRDERRVILVEGYLVKKRSLFRRILTIRDKEEVIPVRPDHKKRDVAYKISDYYEDRKREIRIFFR